MIYQIILENVLHKYLGKQVQQHTKLKLTLLTLSEIYTGYVTSVFISWTTVVDNKIANSEIHIGLH